MKTLIASTLLTLTLVAGCSKKSECEQIYDHTVSLMPADWQAQAKAGKDKAIGKCEKASPEARKCAAAAQSLSDLMKCPQQ